MDVEITVDPQTGQELRVPAFATAEQAIERARLAREGSILPVDMAPEHGTVDVLWHRADGAIVLDGLVPSEVLTSASRWVTFWEVHCDPFTGWDTPPNQEHWREDGARLHEALVPLLWWQFEISYSR